MEQNKIPTVAELLAEEAKKFSSPLTPESITLLIDIVANKHAKNHVKAALVAASKNAKIKYSQAETIERVEDAIYIDRDSILAAYPEENIK